MENRQGDHAGSANGAVSPAMITALTEGACADPFAILGPHGHGDDCVLRVFLPHARAVAVEQAGRRTNMHDLGHGFFVAPAFGAEPYVLSIDWGDARETVRDPYAFGVILSDHDLHLFREGRLFELATTLGANPAVIGGVDGVTFALWAPNARSVCVAGDFNGWSDCRHPMRLRPEAGVWELFLPGVSPGARYKFAITAADGTRLPWRADPLARSAEMPPATASIVAPPPDFGWTDHAWMDGRARRHQREAPISIYEVHLPSWLRAEHDHASGWLSAAERLVPHVAALGFTHIELLPVMEYPFGGSWGYQPLSLFAPTARLGSPADFMLFVDRCHRAGIGVILDWVPGHFPGDEHGLARLDGTALYEHADPREGFHRDWNTLIYNYGRHEVRGFLIASALFWLEKFHLDGLRVDAVASMLYRDYSRPEGEWIPNRHGGRENLEAVAFLRELNAAIRERCPGAITIAEESTAWPKVTGALEDGGLGFHFKWNMGWMHDTLRFFGRDPVHRGHHLEDIRFGLDYAFSENYVLPLSHDEVVHGKRSLLGRMPGDDWQRFAGLRLLLALMWTHPGKKLLFMGGEFGFEREWDHDAPFPWPAADDHFRHGVHRLVADLNALYREHPQLHRLDWHTGGFRWVVPGDPGAVVFAFLRVDAEEEQLSRRDLLVVFNATPVPQHDYPVGVPVPGVWREILNTDAACYAGSGMGNDGRVEALDIASEGWPHSLRLTLPPLGLLVLAPEAAP